MITPGASTSPGTVSVAMGAGTPTLVPPHKTACSQPGDGRHCSVSDGSRHHGSAVHRAILRCGRIVNALHQPGEDDPDRSSRLQSP
jgi:hypothetical protein